MKAAGASSSSSLAGTTLVAGSIVLVTSAVAAVVVALVRARETNTKKKSVSTVQHKKKERKTRVARCPFTAESDFIVETDDKATPTPWDVFADWVSNPSDIPTDALDALSSSSAGTPPRYKPLAARWLNAGISGQDTPGHLKTGLKRLKDQTWFLVEDPVHRFVHELGLKQKNLDKRHTSSGSKNSNCYVQEEPDSIAAQMEVLELFCLYLPKRYPQYYEFHDHKTSNSNNNQSVNPPKGPYILVKPLQQTFYLSDYKDKPLELCARIVQEDLILLRPSRPAVDQSSAYHMAAAAVCFSFAGLEEKLGQPIEFIHAPVPGFEGELRKTMELFFAKFLKMEQPLWRNNWVVTPEAGGQLDNPNYGTDEADATRQLQDGQAVTPPTRSEIDRMFLKVEYQTIRRLPRSNNLLFTVKMMVDPLRELSKVPKAAACLAKSIRGMSPAMREYKGIGNGQDATTDAILQYLDEVGASG